MPVFGSMRALRRTSKTTANLGPTPEQLVQHGDKLLATGQLGGAERAYRKAISLRARFTPAHVQLGIVMFRQQRFPEARGVLEQAVQLDPAAIVARFHLALIGIETGDLLRAIAQLTWVKRLRPEAPESYLALATSYERQGQRQAACEELRALIARAPKHAVAYLRLGKVLLGGGDQAQALNCFEKACMLDRMLAEAHFGRGRLLEAAGRTKEAVPAYQAALKAGYPREAVEARLAQLREPSAA